MIRLHLLSLFVGIAIVLAGCSKSDDNPVSAGGLLSGTVQLWDDKTSTLTDNSGVTVSVDDVTSTTAVTDASGKFSFPALPYGLHDFTFNKSGYGTYRIFGLAHTSAANGTVVPAVQFGKLATTSVSSLSVSGSTYNSSPGVSVVYSVAPVPTAGNRGYVRYFLSTDQGVSATNYMYASPVVSVLNNNIMGGFTREDLLTAGFTSGQTVYIRLYGDAVQSNVYTDPNVGKRTFPNINTTTVAAVSYKIP